MKLGMQSGDEWRGSLRCNQQENGVTRLDIGRVGLGLAKSLISGSAVAIAFRRA